MSLQLDGKFYGVILRNRDQSVVSQDQWMLFLAKDNAVPIMLEAYYNECVRLGAGQDHLSGISALQHRVNLWRTAHPELCKVPDTTQAELML